MGIFSRPEDGSPNTRPYELRYEDGDKWRLGGQKQFTLLTAIQLANHEAGTGTQLFVVDPDTDAVLWAGQQATR
jgi:hypothetical protein